MKAKNALGKKRTAVTEGLVCPCPQCGSLWTFFEPVFREETAILTGLSIKCEKCGESRIVKSDEDDCFVTVNDGAPYCPYSESIAPTEHHRFDPTKYISEEDAIRAEMELLDRCEDLISECEEFESPYSYSDRIEKLYERAYKIGMNDFILRHTTYLIVSAIHEGGELRPVLERCLTMSERGSVTDRCRLMLECHDLERSGADVGWFTEELKRHILRELENMGAVERFERFGSIYVSMRAMDEECSDGILMREMSLAARIEEKEMREMHLASLYRYHSLELFPGGELDEEMRVLRRFRKGLAFAFVEPAIHYGEMNIHDRTKHRIILDDVNYLIGFFRKECLDAAPSMGGRDINNCLARIHLLRYKITRETRELVAAANDALRSLSCDFHRKSINILLECLGDPKMPKKEKEKIERVMRRLDLYSEDP